MHRILVVSTNWLGDALMLTPVFKAIKKKFPVSYLSVMCVERVKSVFEDNPYLDDIVVYPQDNILKLWLLLIYLKRKKFDIAFFIHRSFTRIFICMLAGIRERIGYYRKKTRMILTCKIPPIDPFSLHRQDYYLNIIEQYGIPVEDRKVQFFISENVRNKIERVARQIRKNYRYIIGINPTGNWEKKVWPGSYFSRLMDRLKIELDCEVIIVSSDKYRVKVDEIISSMRTTPINLCGRTTLKELGAWIANCDLFISSDSGPAHLSAGLGIPTLVLFGPTSVRITAPRGERVFVIKKDVGCYLPCYQDECEDNICMKSISVEEVFSSVKNILMRDRKEEYENSG